MRAWVNGQIARGVIRRRVSACSGRSWGAVVGGLTYNFLPFMILPIYVALEKIDFRLTEAARPTCTRRRLPTFRRVIFPLSLPGVFAGSLLVFIPRRGRLHQRQIPGHAPRQA
jgi:spermidine/putrescine transport system permease protein